jgi:hypothetical protein
MYLEATAKRRRELKNGKWAKLRRNCTQHGGPHCDQRAICTAPRASGQPCPLLDLARSAAQIARSSLTQWNCAAVALGFRPRLGPRRCATAPSAPNSATLRLRSTSRVPTADRSQVKRHWRAPTRFCGEHVCGREPFLCGPSVPGPADASRRATDSG